MEGLGGPGRIHEVNHFKHILKEKLRDEEEETRVSPNLKALRVSYISILP